MVPARKLLYDLKWKLKQTASGSKTQTFTTVDMIAALNQAQGFWFANLVTVAERDSKAREDLRIFLEKDKALTLEADKSDEDKSVYALPSNMYKRLNQYVKATKESCCPGVTKRIVLRYVQSDDLNEALQNPYRNASFEYEQLLGDEFGHSLAVYHQQAMDISGVYIDYYRLPGEIHAPSAIKCADPAGRYYDYQGTAITNDTNFEPTARYADQQVTDLAAIILRNANSELADLQAKLQTAVALNSIYTN